MYVRMRLEVLAPGVEHAEEADVGAEVFGIGGDLQQGFGAGAEQQVVDNFLVLQRQPGQLVREGEDNMNVADRQQFLAARGDPLVTGVGLTLWAMPIPAGYGELTITCLMGTLY